MTYHMGNSEHKSNTELELKNIKSIITRYDQSLKSILNYDACICDNFIQHDIFHASPIFTQIMKILCLLLKMYCISYCTYHIYNHHLKQNK